MACMVHAGLASNPSVLARPDCRRQRHLDAHRRGIHSANVSLARSFHFL
jgi:hypothetical protein